MEGLLNPTGIEPTPLQNRVLKVAGLQVLATTPGVVAYWGMGGEPFFEVLGA